MRFGAEKFVFGRDFATMALNPAKGSQEFCRHPPRDPTRRPFSWIKGPTSKGIERGSHFSGDREERGVEK